MDVISEAKDACEIPQQDRDFSSHCLPSYSAELVVGPEGAIEGARGKEMIAEDSDLETASSGGGMFLFKSTAGVGNVTNKNGALQLDADAAHAEVAAAERNVTASSLEITITEAAVGNFSFKEHQSRLEERAMTDVRDANKKDSMEVTDSVEDAAEAVISEFFLEQVKKAADDLLEENYSESLAMLTEAGSIPQVLLDHIDQNLDAMLIAAFQLQMRIVTDPLNYEMCKVSLRKAAVKYLSSKNTPERLELHEAKLAFFRGTGSGPDPPAISQLDSIGFSSFNPLYDELWLPWAARVQFTDHNELGMLLADRKAASWGLQARNLGMLFSFAIPSRQVLKYMVQRAPQAKIAELGAGSGYWAALLQKLGADIVAVDNGSEEIYPRCVFFPACIKQDGTEFLKSGGADGRALFLCWPRLPQENPAFLSFLEIYSGNTIFFVGELEDGCAWAFDHKDEGWEVEEMFDIPTWPGSGIHDGFLCIAKKLADDQSSEAEEPIAS